jgi:hypothetical protein
VVLREEELLDLREAVEREAEEDDLRLVVEREVLLQAMFVRPFFQVHFDVDDKQLDGIDRQDDDEAK